MSKITTFIFDLGGVLIDWNPRYVYQTVFDSEEKVEWFIQNICTLDWNEKQDAGYLIADAVEEKVAEFPEWEKEIRLYYDRWVEMLKGPIQETVDLFRELKETGRFKFYALTNWSGELFPVALEKYDFLQWFDGIVVSGDEKTRKPYPEIYQLLLQRYHVKAEEALFIDDNLRNVKAATELGIKSHQFIRADELRKDLKKKGLL
jgi:2-haloacid dehalogenase